jgi:ABC-type sugar transport system substrate-binding protein
MTAQAESLFNRQENFLGGREMMKKLVLLVSVVLVLSLALVSCEKRGNEEVSLGVATESFDTGWTGPLRDGLKRYRIALMYGQFTDKLGMQMKLAMDYLAEAFNVEFVYLEFGSGGSDGQLATIESALQSGLDGVMTVGATPAMLDACRKAGNVPLIMIQSEPTTADVAKEMAQFSNYLGAVCENDYEVGWKAAEALYTAGSRNFTVCGITKGLSRTHDQRAQAAIDFIKSKSDAQLLADDYSMAMMKEAIDSFAASYPEMDAIFSTFGNEAAYQAIHANDLTGRVRYATIDITESTGEYLDSGDLTWIAGGQYGTTIIGFAILYNYLADGTRIIPDTSVTIYRPFLEVGSMADYATYVKYVDGKIPVYSIGEVGNMIHAFNDEVDFAYFENLGKVYSIADILERHGDLFQ